MGAANRTYTVGRFIYITYKYLKYVLDIEVSFSLQWKHFKPGKTHWILFKIPGLSRPVGTVITEYTVIFLMNAHQVCRQGWGRGYWLPYYNQSPSTSGAVAGETMFRFYMDHQLSHRVRYTLAGRGGGGGALPSQTSTMHSEYHGNGGEQELRAFSKGIY